MRYTLLYNARNQHYSSAGMYISFLQQFALQFFFSIYLSLDFLLSVFFSIYFVLNSICIFKCMFATVVQYLVDRVPPRDDVAQYLFDSLTFAELIIHRLALWARNGCKDSEKVSFLRFHHCELTERFSFFKVISHINDTLSMVGAIFPNTIANQKREMIRVS